METEERNKYKRLSPRQLGRILELVGGHEIN